MSQEFQVVEDLNIQVALWYTIVLFLEQYYAWGLSSLGQSANAEAEFDYSEGRV